ncbi:5,10-methylenetetrahydromethanopterin reductase [soil metagenome]
MHQHGPAAPPVSFGLALPETLSWERLQPMASRLDAVPGLSSLWVFDERFGRDPWVTLGILGALTDRLRLGTCVTDAFIRHPALTGAAIATLAEATQGRAVLGLGAGVSGFRALGIVRQAPATALREAIGFLRALWASPGDFEFEGRAFSFSAARLHFAPVARVPIMIAGRGPRILRLAGELADEVLVATFTDGPLLDHSLERLAEGVAARPPELGPLVRGAWVYASVDDDREAARAAVREGIAVALWGSRPILEELGIALPDDLRQLMDATAYAHTPEVIGRAARLIPDELVDVCSIAGTPQECRERFGRLAARGFEHIAVWPFAPEGRPVEGVIERLVNDIIPAVADAAGSPGRSGQ